MPEYLATYRTDAEPSVDFETNPEGWRRGETDFKQYHDVEYFMADNPTDAIAKAKKIQKETIAKKYCRTTKVYLDQLLEIHQRIDVPEPYFLLTDYWNSEEWNNCGWHTWSNDK